MESETVLVAPLHWGLGHATRCIPIIEQQLERGNRVIIVASGGPKALLEDRFKSCAFIEIPFMLITYPKDGSMVRHFFVRGPQLVLSIWREHLHLKKLITKHGIDVVISDARFGLWNKTVKSIFITHQVQIKSPVFQSLINGLNRWVMNRFDEVWIPDYEKKPGLAGELSHPKKMPLRYSYIGPLSRFKHPLKLKSENNNVVVLISGPEPQRSLFEKQMSKRFENSDQQVLILSGKPDKPNKLERENITVVNHLSDQQLLDELKAAKLVIARSGYSTIMDFHVLGIKAEFISTPGQTEQEYLMQLHSP